MPVVIAFILYLFQTTIWSLLFFQTLNPENTKNTVLTHFLQYMQGNGNAAGKSVRINDTLVLEIHIILEKHHYKAIWAVCILR